MKNLLKTFALALLAGMVLKSCNSETPDSVFDNIIEAYKTFDFKTMKKYAAQSLMSDMEEIGEKIEDAKNDPERRESLERDIQKNKAGKYETVEKCVSEDNSEAEMHVKVTFEDNSYTTLFIHLIKESGKWKADELDF